MNMQYFYEPNFDPVIFSIGPIVLHWYGLMYVLGFMFAMWLLKHNKIGLNDIFKCKQELECLLCLIFVGVLIGGRIGYVFFYYWPFFHIDILWIFKIWEGGMSFHGGLIGVIVATAWFAYYTNQSFLKISDYIVPAVPLGLALGRLGNFINGELWGRVTIEIPWAMLFRHSLSEDLLILQDHAEWKSLFNYYGLLPRHPSQLYEMILEGIILFIIIYLFSYKSGPKPRGSISGLFLVLYGLFRIIIEFFRQPDSHIGLLINNSVTLGQILSCPMIVFGSIILYFSYQPARLNKCNFLKITNIIYKNRS